MRRASRRCSSVARGITGLLPSAGRWSACATRKDSDTWRVSCAIPITSSTCSTYRARIVELEAEIEQARRWNDLERTALLEGELDALTHELAGAIGLGGRDRRAASESGALASVTSLRMRR